MLTELSIRNFAIIDDLHIRFSDGLTILSGETGAGKSIIINAVNLLLGSRASSDLIRSGADAAELEALFAVSGDDEAGCALADHGFDTSEGLLIRRIIARNDRHRVYINGRMATLQMLNAVTENLASISGQHAHQQLLKPENHLRILDQYGGLQALQRTLARQYNEMLPDIDRLRDLGNKERRQHEHRDLLTFQKNEITAANILPGEDDALEQERRRLKHADALHQAVHDSLQRIYDADGSAYELLADVHHKLEDAVKLDAELSDDLRRVADAMFGVEDVSRSLRAYAGGLEIDPGRLDAVEARIDALTRLKRKYGGSLRDIEVRLAEIERELADIENIADAIAELEKSLAQSAESLCRTARELSEKRRRTAAGLSRAVEAELAALKMPGTRFDVSLQTVDAGQHVSPYLVCDGAGVTETGWDRAAFMIAPNVGEQLKPLSVIASGGELSRVVLALKAILVTQESVQTVVFDEVDAGIGGGVAETVGRKLAGLARRHQVICITHLPQIARFGDHHYRIVKGVQGGRSRTTLDALNAEARVEEIARMLGGETITQTTLHHARELMEGP